MNPALSPLRGLRCSRPEPTAHAVGYSLALLRSYAGAERRQKVAHGVSRGLANKHHEPRGGERDFWNSPGKWRFALQTITILFLLLVVAGCRDAKTGKAEVKPGDSTSIENDITTKVFERDRDQDGRMDFRMKTFFRDGTKVMMVTSKLNADGKMAVDSRSFMVDGNMVLTEADENGDGVFETILAVNPETKRLEVFVRERDGTAQPASARVVEAYKKQISAVGEFFDEALGKDANPDRFEESMRAAQKKIQDAEKEKKE